MMLQITELKSKIMSMSKIKLRIISAILFVSSGILGYFSRQEGYLRECMLSRIYVPGRECSYIYYIWELLGVAALFFITALALLIISFKKTKK